jgi:hypothetical protein
MKIFSFFKKKFQEKEETKIVFKDIEKEINNKKQKIQEAQNEPKTRIKESLLELLQGLEKGEEALENLNLEDKKAPERAKLIVRENFIKYRENQDKLR